MNRLRELRNKKKYTLDDIEKKTGINRGTYNNYESGKTNPKEETWQKLANFYGVSVTYIQGAYSKNEIIEMVKSQYKEVLNIERDASINAINKSLLMQKQPLFLETIEDYLIAIGTISYDIPKINCLLTNKQFESLEFWQVNLNKIFNDVAVKWLIEKPNLNANKEDVLLAVDSAMKKIIAESSTVLSKDYGFYHMSAKHQYFLKRIKFLDSHTFYEEMQSPIGQTFLVPYFDFSKINTD